MHECESARGTRKWPGLGLSRSLPRHIHAYSAFLSRMHRARPPHRRRPWPVPTRGTRRERRESRGDETKRVRCEKGRRNERGITVARKGFNESCLLLAQIATSTEKISILTAYPPSLIPFLENARPFMWWLVLMVLRVYLLLLKVKSSS